ncbi:MAG: hypothetical protein PHD26_06245, partial [Methanosarcinaceae archaeon]|nr:hypothetical protein [Methanosarcinaceae archaeon]
AMKKSISLIAVLALLTLAFSGCVGEQAQQENGTTEPESPELETPAVANPETPEDPEDSETVLMKEGAIKELPSKFAYLATLPESVDELKAEYKAENVSGILNGSKSLYKYSNKTDFYVDVLECESGEAADALILAYKSSFKPLRVGDRFVEESFNGHFATKITTYITNGGEQVPRYTYIWKNENFVFVVRGNTENTALTMKLAEATGK